MRFLGGVISAGTERSSSHSSHHTSPSCLPEGKVPESSNSARMSMLSPDRLVVQCFVGKRSVEGVWTWG